MSSWRWALARSIGTSHERSRTPCQDYGGARLVPGIDGDVMVAVISDGAGSAQHSRFGSKIVCLTMLRQIADYLRRRPLADLEQEDAMDWVDEVRERINATAMRFSARPRDFAATLVSVLAGPDTTVVLHVGDGAAVVRRDGADGWEVPSWPFQGEYASMTTFVTDDPQARLVFDKSDRPLSEFAVFSDGIERLVLDSQERSAHQPFFDRITNPLKASRADGRDMALSKALEQYLASPNVCERTDDDKTLFLGVRL